MTLSVKGLFTRAVALLALTACLLLAGWQPRAQAATPTAPRGAAAALIAPHPAVITFPMSHSLGPVLVSNTYPFYEGLSVRLSADGRLDASQHLINHSWFAGFKGAAGVIMYDSVGNIIWSSHSNTYGVDGMFVPWGNYDVFRTWTEQVPQDVLNTPGLRMEVALWNNPQWTDWNTILDAIQQGVSIIKG